MIRPINKITTIDDFIKETLIAEIKTKHPNLDLDKAIITIENLDKNQIVQGKELKIKIKPTKKSKNKNEINFKAQINYNYEPEEQLEVITKILKPAIPKEFWECRNNGKYNMIKWDATTYDNVANMVVEKVKPLSWLLEAKHLGIKIAAELFAASYWTNFNTRWWHLNAGYDNGAWPGYSNLPSKNNSIKNVNSLYDKNITNTYFNQIFAIIEKKLNDSGINNCRITKETVTGNCSGKFSHAVGNLAFNKAKSDDIIWANDNRYFFIQISFKIEIPFKNRTLNPIFPGVVFYLSDELDLYSYI